MTVPVQFPSPSAVVYDMVGFLLGVCKRYPCDQFGRMDVYFGDDTFPVLTKFNRCTNTISYHLNYENAWRLRGFRPL